MSKAIKCFSLTKKQTSVCNREATLSFTLSTLSNCPPASPPPAFSHQLKGDIYQTG